MRLFIGALSLLFILSSCGKNEEYEKQISNLNNDLKALQEQLASMQTAEEEEAKTELDATGIAIVDMQKLLKEYKGYQTADSRYRAVINRYADELKKLETELQNRYALIQEEAKRFGEDYVKDDIVKFQQFQQQAYEKERELTEKSQQLEAEMLRDVLDQVNTHAKKYAQANGYKMIWFTAVENNIFYADDEINITDIYIEAVNKAYDEKN